MINKKKNLDSKFIRYEEEVLFLKKQLNLKKEEINNLNSLIIELKNASLLYKTKSITDSLTGLYNRNGLINKVIEYGVRDYLLVNIDIDNFKLVNDIYGHHKGDEVLCRISEIFRQNVQSNDVVVRYGGDEFLILFVTKDNDLVNRVINGMQKELKCYIEKFNRINNNKISPDKLVSFSYGVCEYNSRLDLELLDETDVKLRKLQKIIDETDTYLYEQKKEKKKVKSK